MTDYTFVSFVSLYALHYIYLHMTCVQTTFDITHVKHSYSFMYMAILKKKKKKNCHMKECELIIFLNNTLFF